MKTKKNVSIILAALIMIAAVPAFAAAANVQLGYAKATARYIYGGSAYGKLNGYVEVANLGYNKQVEIYYTERKANNWQVIQASYVGPTSGNKEVWSFKSPEHSFSPRLSADFQFAIKYTVNGQVYWDNNNGNDYKVGVGPRPIYPEFAIGSSVVFLSDARANAVTWGEDPHTSFHGRVIVKNLGYHKNIQLVYSTDNWATVKTVNAYYGHPGNGCEIWYVDAKLAAGISNLKFAVSYTVNGNTYWDNNFSRNYEMNVPGEIK